MDVRVRTVEWTSGWGRGGVLWVEFARGSATPTRGCQGGRKGLETGGGGERAQFYSDLPVYYRASAVSHVENYVPSLKGTVSC